jgi:hypothetical protein
MLSASSRFFFIFFTQAAGAGHWADGAGQCSDGNGQVTSCKWGQMYWGAGHTYSAPTEAPELAADVDGTDVSGSLANLSGPGADGWSAITQFIINCGGQDVIVTAKALALGNAILTDLDPNSDYTCSVVAVKDPGGERCRPANVYHRLDDERSANLATLSSDPNVVLPNSNSLLCG